MITVIYGEIINMYAGSVYMYTDFYLLYIYIYTYLYMHAFLYGHAHIHTVSRG